MYKDKLHDSSLKEKSDWKSKEIIAPIILLEQGLQRNLINNSKDHSKYHLCMQQWEKERGKNYYPKKQLLQV